MGLEQYFLRGTEFQFARCLDWLITTNTPLDQAQIGHTTLFKFYQRLEADDTARDRIHLLNQVTGFPKQIST